MAALAASTGHPAVGANDSGRGGLDQNNERVSILNPAHDPAQGGADDPLKQKWAKQDRTDL